MKYLCVGNSVYDTTVITKEFPIENKKAVVDEVVECGGGNGANSAFLLASWKCDVDLMSALGDDYFGKKIMQEYFNVGIEPTYIEVKNDYKTPRSYIVSSIKNKTRTILTSPKKEIKKLRVDTSKKYDYILIDGNYIETAKELLNKNKSATSILDLEKNKKDIVELGKNVTYIICSEDFAEEYTKISLKNYQIKDLKECYTRLKNNFTNQNIIITLGKKGSFTKLDDQYKIIPTIKVNSIDTTGAGDIFHASFAYFLSKGFSLEDTIKYSSIASALSTTKIGCRYKIPKLGEVLNYDKII